MSAFSTLSGLLACRARSGGQNCTAARDLHAHAIKVPEEQLADAPMTEGIHGGKDPMSDWQTYLPRTATPQGLSGCGLGD